MIVARLGHTRNEVVGLADRHTLAVQSWLSTRSPQAKRFQGIGITVGSSGLAVRLLNLALGGDYPDGTPDAMIANEIEAVKTFFAQRGVCWMWWLGPTPRRRDIAQRLHHHGLTYHKALPAMVAPLPAQFPPLSPNVQVWQAASRADLEAASTIRRVAFQFPAGTALSYFEDMADDWLRGDPACLYLARLDDGPPAAIGALIIGAGLPGVYVMATLPEWQRRGLGKAILARILSDASADGHTLIVLTAGQKGYPLYRKFGFEHVFDYYLAWEQR
jgi:GNAT superfamily N-acetyltransferase